MTGWYWWALWALLFAVSFALLERYAFAHPDRQWTLSRVMATLGARFPLSLVVWGIFIGGLSVHFFWHFCL
jgi:hypothetical protein